MSDGRCSDCGEMALDRWATRCADCEIARQADRIAELEQQLAQAQADLALWKDASKGGYWGQRAAEWKQRAEAAEAQVAHLCDLLRQVGGLFDPTAIPAAAEKLLAAQRACEAIDAWIGQKKPGDYGVAQDVDCELEDWRKAGQS